MPRESQCPGPNCVWFCKRFNESSFLRLGALMFLEPLVACRKKLKSNWTFYNWAGPNFAPKISLLILAQTNNIYIHTIDQEHQKPVVEITTHKKSGFIQSVWWKNQRKTMKSPAFYHRVCHRGMWHRMEISARHASRASIFRVALWTLWLRSPSTACPKTRQL